MARDPRQLALTYLQTHQVLTLATMGVEGVWASAVFYASVVFDFYFLSAAHTRHAQNMVTNTHVAGTIQEDYRDWPAIKGIQLEGDVVLLTGEQRASAEALYSQRYPFIQQANPQIRAGLAKVNWYRLQPTRLYFIDNSIRLGHRDEIGLP